MCGILAILGKKFLKERAEGLLKKLAGRGPEGGRLLEGEGFQLGFTRLAINGLDSSGMQPMQGDSLAWMCNGEIYNYVELARAYRLSLGSSDCSVLGGLFKKLGSMTDAKTFFQSLDGVFAMVIIDASAGIAYVGRDPYGVRPLYVGYSVDGNSIKNIVFASELKALDLSACAIVEPFPPGHYAAYDIKTLTRIGFEPYHSIPWLKNPLYTVAKEAQVALNVALVSAVKKRMMTERPVAALLSGGLDSSLIAALVQKQLVSAGKPALKTFSIGFEGSEDLRHARLVADHIHSDHTEIIMTAAEFFEAIPEVIKDIESFDITTVRASVGNWLVSREISRRTDCKVVFNGDGSDEVLGGYMFNYYAKNEIEFDDACKDLTREIHLYDSRRLDRCLARFGLEARVPFLDIDFVKNYWQIPATIRMPSYNNCEKYLLRKAFDDDTYLSKSCLYRTKEAFSDGISSKKNSWFSIIEKKMENEVADIAPTKEASYYKRKFISYFGEERLSIINHYWQPRFINDNSKDYIDPSARILNIYNK